MAGVFGSAATNSAVVTTSILLGALFIGLAATVVLSVIPSFTATNPATPLGEKYCINNMRVIVRFNISNLNGTSRQVATNYPLSLACSRILNNYYSDGQLSSCLISNCSLMRNTFPLNNVLVTDNLICTSTVIYYSVRCTDQGVLSGLYNYITSSGNSNCRKTRMARINAALGGSSTTRYPNVQTFVISNTAVYINSIFTHMFSNYTQPGVEYCGSASQTAIASAVSVQSSG